MPLAHPAIDQNIHGVHMTWQKWQLTKYAVMGLRWIQVSDVRELIKKKRCHTMIAGVDSFRVYLWTFLMYERCVNTGESAAVFGFTVKIKVVEYLLNETTAAGLLGGSVGKVSKVSEVSKVGWNDVKWLHDFMDAWLHGCMGE